MKQFSTKTAAFYIGMSPDWLVLKREQGLGPSYSKYGSASNAPIRYSKIDLDAYIESTKIKVN